MKPAVGGGFPVLLETDLGRMPPVRQMKPVPVTPFQSLQLSFNGFPDIGHRHGFSHCFFMVSCFHPESSAHLKPLILCEGQKHAWDWQRLSQANCDWCHSGRVYTGPGTGKNPASA
jgi:hypothetical protein